VPPATSSTRRRGASCSPSTPTSLPVVFIAGGPVAPQCRWWSSRPARRSPVDKPVAALYFLP
jgi:hypothetical protein